MKEPIAGSGRYLSDFVIQGPRDHQGRSLRDLDLKKRMFRYPCSFLIYSTEFDGLPPVVRDRFYRRLWEVVTGADQTPAYVRLTASDRQSIYEILLDTKPDLPGYWRAPQAGAK